MQVTAVQQDRGNGIGSRTATKACREHVALLFIKLT